MRCPDRTPDEFGRLRALAEYDIDPATGLASLDPIVQLAVRLFDCPAAAVNLVGEDHVYFAASAGVGECDMSRDASFCAHAINQGDVMVVEDAALDERFHDNPLVTGGLIRFYAGVPLVSPSGHALGALCVVDGEPHATFAETDRQRLAELAQLVADRLELRRIEVAAQACTPDFLASATISPDAVISCALDGHIVECNQAAGHLFGLPLSSMRGLDLAALVAEGARRSLKDALARAFDGKSDISEPVRLTALGRGGALFDADLHVTPHSGEDSARVAIVVHDATGSRRGQDALVHLARHDPVTGLPNRDALTSRLETMLAEQNSIGLILVDLVGFSDINHMLGYATGDRMLSEVGARIVAATQGAVMVTRLSGDEFAVVTARRDPLALARTARAINAALARPFHLKGQEIRIGSCCGIAMAPDHAEGVDDLVANAERAMMRARASGNDGVALYQPQMRAEAVARRQIETELHHALEEGQFTLDFQPQVMLDTGRVVGAEALLRWRHPVRGLLPPAAFLPALEASSLAPAVGTWVLDQACAQVALWRRSFPHMRMSVNLFAAQFAQGYLPAIVAGTLAMHGLPPEALELEITENVLLDNQSQLLKQITAIRDSGVNVSFDDFGTGFASLNLLRDYPVSHIKIDKGFVQKAESSQRDRAIVTGLVSMARELGLGVIAEGVETSTSAAWLLSHGCRTAQGYHFGRPCPPGQFVDRHLHYRDVAAAS